MGIDKNAAIAEIDAALRYSSNTEESVTIAHATLFRLAPSGSAYLDRTEKAINTKVINASQGQKNAYTLEKLHGILKALRVAYVSDQISTFEELVHANLFSDFLEMAEHLHVTGYHQAAGVIAGSVLESHVRQMCEKHGITLPDHPKLESMNVELARAKVYDKNEQKQVTAWYGLRSSAAHGKHDEYDKVRIEGMIRGIREFLSRHKA